MFVAQSTTGGSGGTWRLEQVEVSIHIPEDEIEAMAERRLRETLADDGATIYWCVWDVPTLSELGEHCSELSATNSTPRLDGGGGGHRHAAPDGVGRPCPGPDR